MTFSKVIIFACLFSYALVQAKWIDSKDVIDSEDDIIRDNVGIAGGTEIPIQQAPYVVALYNEGQAFGTGSIIHEQFILTAASVVKNIPGRFYVLAGTDCKWCAPERQGKLHMVGDRFCHDKFSNEPDNDICLLKLSEPLGFGPKRAKINLPEQDSEFGIGIPANIAGWGMMENYTNPDHLRGTTVELLDSGLCSYYNHSFTMTDNMICAGTPDNGPCMGDVGAPLTLNNIQIGVSLSSFVEKDACGPSAFTKVSKFVCWINKTIWNNL